MSSTAPAISHPSTSTGKPSAVSQQTGPQPGARLAPTSSSAALWLLSSGARGRTVRRLRGEAWARNFTRRTVGAGAVKRRTPPPILVADVRLSLCRRPMPASVPTLVRFRTLIGRHSRSTPVEARRLMLWAGPVVQASAPVRCLVAQCRCARHPHLAIDSAQHEVARRPPTDRRRSRYASRNGRGATNGR
jgi:hypothetical protein